MTCGTCGSPLPSGATFCPGCGTPVAAAPPGPSFAPLPPPPPGRPAEAAPPPRPGWAPPPQAYGPPQGHAPMPMPYGGGPAYGRPTVPPPRMRGGTNRYAAASLWCSLTFFLFPITIVLAGIGLAQLARPGNDEGGRGMAIAGLVIGIVELLIVVAVFAA